MEPTTKVHRFDIGPEIAELKLRSQAGTVLVSAAVLDVSLNLQRVARGIALLGLGKRNNVVSATPRPRSDWSHLIVIRRMYPNPPASCPAQRTTRRSAPQSIYHRNRCRTHR
jgi:hypothetical protein